MTKGLRQPYDAIFAAFRCGFRWDFIASDLAKSANKKEVTKYQRLKPNSQVATCEFPTQQQRKIGYRRRVGCHRSRCLSIESVILRRSLRDVAAAVEVRAAANRTEIEADGG
jgi:hypothetical protein